MKNRTHPAAVWILLGFISMISMACSPLNVQPGSAINFDAIIFLSSWTQSGNLQLTKGEYRETVMPGAASQIVVRLTDNVVVGKIGGKETAAVILVTNAGGSGTFYDLAFLIRKPQGWINTDVTHLGDRVKIYSLVFENKMIVVDLATQGPGDPMCCPRKREIRRFVVADDRLTVY
ncbi:MAG: hypothetical protein JSU83_07905 [Deltaproteobacteria bacterium]|nr:MAG: hypothetical protein JSU83_07905 [Deltaproteobacteria bacterium]